MTDNETLLDKAIINYNSAIMIRKCMNDDEAYLNVIGYLMQQATELCIKYQLESQGVEYPKTHDIDQLIRIGTKAGAALVMTDYIYEHSEMLTAWEKNTRYIIGYQPELRKIDTAIDGVGAFLTNVQENELEMEVPENDGLEPDDDLER